VSRVIFLMSKKDYGPMCVTYDRRGGGDGMDAPNPADFGRQSATSFGLCAVISWIFFLFIVNKTQNEKEKTARWKCTRKCLMEMKPEQVRLRRQHRKSPLSKIPLSFLFFWPWHEFPPLNFKKCHPLPYVISRFCKIWKLAQNSNI
jgi:hypothetical protein